MQIRPMSLADLPGVLAVQRACYGPGHLEPLEAFASKLTASPMTCWVAEAAKLTRFGDSARFMRAGL